MTSEIYTLAREACTKHDDINDGVQYCWQRTRDDKKLYRSIVEQLVRNAFREAIYDVRHQNLDSLRCYSKRRGLAMCGSAIKEVRQCEAGQDEQYTDDDPHDGGWRRGF